MSEDKRKLIITIDGDGNQRPEWIKNIHQIIRSHPTLKFTTSIITCYLNGEMHQDIREELTNHTSNLLKEPNVEPASHTHTHPFDWENPVANILAEKWSVDDEVNKSKATIKQLSGKTPKMLLLSGNCNPTGKQVEQIYRNNMTPFNGGAHDEEPYRLIDGYRVYNQRGLPDVHYHGIRKWREGKAYLDYPDGYKNAVFYFKEHVDRVVHVYFHFYAGEFKETVDAVNHVLDWCVSQGFESMYLSEYIETLL